MSDAHAFSIEFNIDDGNYSGQFKSIADQLMNHAALIVDEAVFRIIDIEFYLFLNEKHPDPFVHCHEMQKTSMSWYFHESGNGMDLTFGDKEFYGGILIKGVQYLNASEKLYNGPFKAMSAIMQSIRNARMHDCKRLVLVDKHDLNKMNVSSSARNNLWLHGTITVEFYNAIMNKLEDGDKVLFKKLYPVKNRNKYQRIKCSKSENKKYIEDIPLYNEYYCKPYRCYLDFSMVKNDVKKHFTDIPENLS